MQVEMNANQIYREIAIILQQPHLIIIYIYSNLTLRAPVLKCFQMLQVIQKSFLNIFHRKMNKTLHATAFDPDYPQLARTKLMTDLFCIQWKGN